ncbi:MAG: RHS repeat-associated core domain-containing protein [Deferrisomatales bacterium]|nr:RHS repeat-associated core domain-containing protein [Deferrisomatales bacterium]
MYDPANLLTEEVTVPGLLPTVFDYDLRGRLETVTVGSRITTFAYDTNGYLDYLVTPDSKTIDYAYDVMGRLREEVLPDTSVVQYDYDDNGNLTVLTTPKTISHGFDYTANDQGESYTTPLSGSYAYTYDTERKLKTVTFPSGQGIANTYVDGILDNMVTPEGTITYAHDCGGRITEAAQGTESVTLAFDGPLLTSDTRMGLLNDSMTYGYNNDFHLTSFTYAGGTEIFGYDLDGLLTSARGFTITRDLQNGLPEEVSDGTAAIARIFNGYGELDGQTWEVGGSGVYAWSVPQRDDAGRIQQRVETIAGETITWDYQYDLVGRLEKVWKDGVLVEEYGYDANGNRISETNILRGIAGRTTTHDDEDRIITAGTDVYEFELDGFLTRKTTAEGVTTYDYSSRGELLSVSLPDGRIIGYGHDPLGRRIAKRIDGVIVEKYLWAGVNQKLLAIYDGSDGLVTRFTYADDRMPVSIASSGTTYYLAYDQVGSLRAVVDNAGTVVQRVDYDSFGNVITKTNPNFAIPLGFAGGLQDQDTGLARFGVRDYDPSVARWVAKDPIGFAGNDVNLYGYVLGDPISFVDPDGEIGIIAGLVIAGAISGGASWGGLHIANRLQGLVSGNPNPAIHGSTNPHYRMSNLINQVSIGAPFYSHGIALCAVGGATAMASSPQLVASGLVYAGTPQGQNAFQQASHFVQGMLMPPPPPMSWPGVAGGLLDLYGKISSGELDPPLLGP